MTQDEFWSYIEESFQKSSGDHERQAGVLLARLNSLDTMELEDFQNHYEILFHRLYRWDLWGAAWLIGLDCSEDGFMDFRAWLIALGRNFYEGAAADPDTFFANLDDELLDAGMSEYWAAAFGLRFVAQQIYEDRVGEPPITVVAPADLAGERWSEDRPEDLQRLLPMLCERLGYPHYQAAPDEIIDAEAALDEFPRGSGQALGCLFGLGGAIAIALGYDYKINDVPASWLGAVVVTVGIFFFLFPRSRLVRQTLQNLKGK